MGLLERLHQVVFARLLRQFDQRFPAGEIDYSKSGMTLR
jgi:hypothetical protein